MILSSRMSQRFQTISRQIVNILRCHHKKRILWRRFFLAVPYSNCASYCKTVDSNLYSLTAKRWGTIRQPLRFSVKGPFLLLVKKTAARQNWFIVTGAFGWCWISLLRRKLFGMSFSKSWRNVLSLICCFWSSSSMLPPSRTTSVTKKIWGHRTLVWCLLKSLHSQLGIVQMFNVSKDLFDTCSVYVVFSSLTFVNI